MPTLRTHAAPPAGRSAARARVRRGVLLAAFATLGAVDRAAAQAETPFEVDLLRPTGRGPFIAVDSASGTAVGRTEGRLLLTHSARPLVAVAPGPDVEGRRVPLVASSSRVLAVAHHGVTRSLELSLAVPFTLARTGSGLDGIRSTEPAALAGGGLGRLLFGVHYEAASLRAGTGRFHARFGFELALPTVGDGDYLGPAAVGWLPHGTFGLQQGPFTFGTYLGFRLERSTLLLDTRQGSALDGRLGIGFQALQGWLSVGLEGLLLASLLPQPNGGASVPAEWLGSVQSRLGTSWLDLGLGFGTALPVVAGREGAEASPPAPAWRGIVFLGLHGPRR